MKRPFVLIALAAFLLIGFAAPGMAATTNIKGTWTGTGKAINAKGKVSASVPVTFVVKGQSGTLFWGYIDMTFDDGTERSTFSGNLNGQSLIAGGIFAGEASAVLLGTVVSSSKITLQGVKFPADVSGTSKTGTLTVTVTK